jgi:hypothetical protein
MNAHQAWLRAGLFMLLALTAAQSQTANSTPPPAAAPASAIKVKKPKTPPVAQKPAGAGATGSQSGPAAADAPKTDAAKTSLAARLENARLDAIDSSYASISLTDCVPAQPDPHKIVCNGKAYQVKISDSALRARVQQFHVGDHLRVDINEKGELQELRGPWSLPNNPPTDSAKEIDPLCRLAVLGACALAILGLAAVVTGGAPLKFIIGMDCRYSNSKFQLALWFWVALSTYLAVVVFRVWYAGWDFFGAVDIPQHLLALSGMSAITYGGAKAITTAKVDAAANPVNAPGAAVQRAVNANPKNANGRSTSQARFFQDLTQNDFGGFDFGDFQMLLVTLLAVGMYLILIFHFLGTVEFLKTAKLPDVDTTILASFGIGQGAYLTKKAAGDVGTS